MKIGIARFPGTNCDYDIEFMVQKKGHTPVWLWHEDHRDLTDLDAVIIPGGFSFGDYLRCGALAARSALMEDVRRFAEKGGAVLGICNGFQILCESGLLPGALVRNRGGRFIDDWVDLEVVNAAERFGVHHKRGQRLRLPIAHGEGRFYAPADELKSLFDQGQIWLRYSLNPNGSLQDIAGVLSKNKRVAGLMPHPERALFDWMGGTDGWGFLP